MGSIIIIEDNTLSTHIPHGVYTDPILESVIPIILEGIYQDSLIGDNIPIISGNIGGNSDLDKIQLHLEYLFRKEVQKVDVRNILEFNIPELCEVYRDSIHYLIKLKTRI